MAHHIVPACVAEMRRCALLLGALLCLQAPGLASADGLNEWSGSPAAAGEVWFVPQGVIELGSGPPQAYYLQTQFGLAKDLDLIATPTFTAAEGELEMPILDIYARYALTGNLMVGLGASTRLVFDQMPGVILGLFQDRKSVV